MLVTCSTRAEWKAERRKGLGATEIVILLGAAKWSSPFAIYHEKANGIDIPVDERRLEMGRYLEPSLARVYADRTGRTVRSLGEFSLVRHDVHPWHQATLDYLVEDRERGLGILELKTSSVFARAEKRDDEGDEEEADDEPRGHLWDDGPPQRVVIQVNAQLSAAEGLGVTWADTAVLVGHDDFRIFPVNRDDKLISLIRERGASFWHGVETKTPPDIDWSEATRSAIRALYPRQTPGKERALTEEELGWVARILDLRAARHTVIQEEKLLKNRLALALGDVEKADAGAFGVVTYKTIPAWSDMSRRKEYRKLDLPRARKAKD